MYEDREDGWFWVWGLMTIAIVIMVAFAVWYSSSCEVVETYDFHAVITDLRTHRVYSPATKTTTRKYYLHWENGAERGIEHISLSKYRNLREGDLIHIYAIVQETPFGIQTIYEIKP